jgi:apolipoprotein N-acyltransferase
MPFDSPSPALSRWAPLWALLAGALAVLSFAPLSWWPVQIASLALLLWLAAGQASVRRAALIGWCFSLGWMVAGTYWLYISMHDYGGMPAPMAAAAVLLLSAAMALYAAMAMAAGTWLRLRCALSPAATLLLAYPPLWALGEWLRGWIATGFPWIASGYAHVNSPLAGFAPLIGVYGIGWLAVMLAACVVLAFSSRRKPALALGAALLALGLLLNQLAWTEKHGAPISVRLLQGNVAQEMKFNPDQANDTLSLYYEMLTEARADLIATPETALPLMAHALPPDYLELLASFARQSKSNLLVGVPVSDGPGTYANSLLGFPAVPGAGRQPYRYDKHHLVPFGEFIPAGFRWFVDMMHIPLGDFTRGAVLQLPFEAAGQWIMPNICYEDLFGGEIADQIAASHFSGRPQPTMLLNVSNIAWFGDSIALPQHLQISQMRSLETRRPMLRATNTGATAVIDAAGRVQAQLRPFTHGTLAAKVQGMSGWTPYILFGNTLVVTAALLLLAGIWFPHRKRRQANARTS